LHTIPSIQNLANFSNNQLEVDMLRLDLVHPIVSGNKWYKLKHHLLAAKAQNATLLASFGGPYSNHIVALAHAAKQNGFKSLGYIRANKGEPLTPTIQQAIHDGMTIQYLGRSSFQERKKHILQTSSPPHHTYFIEEGGYGALGTKGITELFSSLPLTQYDYILCAVGTGTMMAGLINGAQMHQKIVGIPVLKNEGSIASEIRALLIDPSKEFTLLHQFHQGGYAKTTPAQIDWMNQFWNLTQIPTDIVYTGKLIYAFHQLLQSNYFIKDTKILMVHSGGLQGNQSLAKDVLIYPINSHSKMC